MMSCSQTLLVSKVRFLLFFVFSTCQLRISGDLEVKGKLLAAFFVSFFMLPRQEHKNSLYVLGMDSLDIMNDLDTISFLDNNTWNNTPVVSTSNSLSSNLHPASYSSFANSYLEDMTGSTAIMVNPNNVMPIHPLQHQQVTSLSVNTGLHSPNSHSQSSPQSPMPSPMFATQQMPTQPPQQVYSATQRPAKSVRVLPPVSSPMQQVK